MFQEVNIKCIFLLILIRLRSLKASQIQTESCTCTNNQNIEMSCLEDQLNYSIGLDQLKIESLNKPIAIIVRNKWISRIKSLENKYLKNVISLRIENCKMKELKTNSFKGMISLNELFILRVVDK